MVIEQVHHRTVESEAKRYFPEWEAVAGMIQYGAEACRRRPSGASRRCAVLSTLHSGPGHAALSDTMARRLHGFGAGGDVWEAVIARRRGQSEKRSPFRHEVLARAPLREEMSRVIRSVSR